MTASAHTSNVVLFPLCDKSGVMLQALEPISQNRPNARAERSGTRPDAVVFAWLLDLPTEIDSAQAAKAVLDVTRHQVSLLTPYQRSVVYELAKLMKSKDSEWNSLPSNPINRRFKTVRRGRGFFSRDNQEARQITTRNRNAKFVCLQGGLDDQD